MAVDGDDALPRPSSNQIAARKQNRRPCISRSAFHSERVPHSGAMRYRSHGADIDVYALGREECPLVSECKSRKAGGGLSCITLANKIF
jgi:hypothetical protein